MSANPDTASGEDGGAAHSFELSDHVVANIGIHLATADDSCAPGMHVHVVPLLLEPDGHLDFGALGVLLDTASSQAVGFGPFVHSDISINRIARPQSDVVYAEAVALRTGKRSSIVHVSARDSLGTVIADSTQQIVLKWPLPGAHYDHSDPDANRERFHAALDGVCRLPGRLHDAVGIERVVGPDGAANWSMPSSPLSRNGFGGLHGGVAFDLVTEAASGGIEVVVGVPAESQSALLRFLWPATVGPFRAVPTVLPQDGDAVFVRVAVHDDGQDGKLCIVGEVHATLALAER
jgi:acyl-coenzyme A thioesterase PaaI-like protein